MEITRWLENFANMYNCFFSEKCTDETLEIFRNLQLYRLKILHSIFLHKYTE